MDFPDIESTGMDDLKRRKMVEDAVKARRWSLLPQALAGAGDTLSSANQVYGGGGSAGAQDAVIKGVDSNLADSNQQFESGLLNHPGSDISKQYQNLLGKFLGKDPKSFTKMSAAQIKDQIPAIEKLSNMENQRDMKQQSLEQAAQARADSAANRKLQFEALQQNRSAVDQDRDAKRQLQEQQAMEGKVQKHAATLQNESLPELVATYNQLAPVFESGKDVPGVGLLDSHVPGFMLSAGGKEVRTNLQQLSNALLKARSGAAVTDPEYRRFLLELQAGSVPTEEAIRVHLSKMGQDAKTVIGQLEAGLPEEALATYKSRPGAVTSDSVKVFEPKASSTVAGGETKRKTKDGRIAIFDANKKFVRYE
jgi:hypothetical protein